MNKSSELQEKICQQLGLSAEQFLETQNWLIENDRGLELTNAQQGQLIDIQLESDDDAAKNLALTEDQTLEIFEIMLRSQLEQENLVNERSSSNDCSDDELSDLLIVHNYKTNDKIYLQYGVELKHFNFAVKHYADTSKTFETRLIEKEEEIMDCSV